MKIALVGYGPQNQSAFEYWNNGQNEITICDVDPDSKAPAGIATQLGEHYLENLERFDLVVRTSSVHPHALTAANGDGILQKTTTATNEFFRVCPSKYIVGVTGTKGK